MIEQKCKLDYNDCKKIRDELFMFIWSFKHGDNIMYNFEILKALFETAKINEKNDILNKPITITIVSIIEAILVDFIYRLYGATNHLSVGLDYIKVKSIKKEIESKKVKKRDKESGSIYYSIKKYNYSDIIKIMSKYELFGNKNDIIYDSLKEFGNMRNRVHIENYYNNLEDREEKVFTSARVEKLEEILFELWKMMINKHQRPW